MAKKALIISASLRRHGNSETLCDQFALGSKKQAYEVLKHKQ